MNRLHLKPVIAAAVGSLLFFSNLLAAQDSPYAPKILPPAPHAARVRITQGPELESANEKSAIIRWESNNPGGSDEHFAVLHYGTDPNDLSQTAKSHIRLNQNHPSTVFRVRVEGLAPQTKYYYTVDSMTAQGRSDGVKSPVKSFMTR
ncbi:MAG TPA: fibronectin type III domain-containing protein [Candidatus Acidoferrum sp.]|jgi:Purple acid Phosphatase, N-terminal domain|nr:fibronectin type III domain-containing protein [Candidatus Acidoferrum sp.]